MSRIPVVALVLGLVLTAVAGLSWSCSTLQHRPRASSSASSTAPAQEWIVLNLPPTASQLEFGAAVYRLVCQDCHGDRGQGLTPEWRATWAPQDQNCWQSKCHAANHPPEGFILPVAPPVVGVGAMSSFETAADLHNFIQTEMPWYRPGSLTEKDSWAVTAHILQMNRININGELNLATAAQVRLH